MSQQAMLQIEMRDVSGLVPYSKNSREHSEGQVSQLAASIKEFGFTNPVLIASDGGVIAGHGRVRAAQKLGMDQVPVIVLSDLTPTQRRAYVIADNRLAENASWNLEMLRDEAEALAGLGFDVDLTGLEADDLLADDEDARIGKEDGAGSDPDGGEVNFVIQYNIVFDDAFQQQRFFDFVKWLKVTYPNGSTLGERLSEFIGEQMNG